MKTENLPPAEPAFDRELDSSTFKIGDEVQVKDLPSVKGPITHIRYAQGSDDFTRCKVGGKYWNEGGLELIKSMNKNDSVSDDGDDHGDPMSRWQDNMKEGNLDDVENWLNESVAPKQSLNEEVVWNRPLLNSNGKPIKINLSAIGEIIRNEQERRKSKKFKKLTDMINVVTEQPRQIL